MQITEEQIANICDNYCRYRKSLDAAIKRLYSMSPYEFQRKLNEERVREMVETFENERCENCPLSEVMKCKD